MLKSDLIGNKAVGFIWKGWLGGVLFFVAVFFLLFWALGNRSLWGSEGRWAEITREMFTTGDFFHPTIGGEPYFEKPLLTYWVIAALSAITGRLDEFILRLPSALAALVVLVCTIYLGQRLWSRQTGWLAGSLLLTSYGLLMYSHVASAETENLAAVMLAVTWYWTRRDRPGFVTFLVFYLILFIGSNMKGLTAFVVPLLIVLPDLLRQRRWRWLLWPSHWLALVIGVAVYFAPFIYASMSRPESYRESGLVFVFRENILRYVQPFDHKGPIYLYLGVVPLLTLPWFPIFSGAIITSATNWRKLDEKTRWLIQAIVIIFAFFTFSGSRRNYYILPILPFCMLFMAVFLAEFSQEIVGRHRERGLLIQKRVLVITAILEAALGPLIVWILINNRGWELPGLFGISCLIIGVAALLMGILTDKVIDKMLRGGQFKTIWVSIVMAIVLMGGFFAWQYNILEYTRTERPFALRMKKVVESFPHRRVAFYHGYGDKMLFYMQLGTPVTLLADEKDLRVFLKSGEPGIIISQSRYIAGTVASMLPSQPAYAETCYKWESPDRKFRAWLINQNNRQNETET
jgi:4-amino-4-deoxy-L-arabinose transferase-like glycosyltransferase